MIFKLVSLLMLAIVEVCLGSVQDFDKNHSSYTNFKITKAEPVFFRVSNPGLLQFNNLVASQKTKNNLIIAVGYSETQPTIKEDNSVDNAEIVIEYSNRPFVSIPLIMYKKSKVFFIALFNTNTDDALTSDYEIQIQLLDSSYIQADINLKHETTISYSIFEGENTFLFGRFTEINTDPGIKYFLHSQFFLRYPDKKSIIEYRIIPNDSEFDSRTALSDYFLKGDFRSVSLLDELETSEIIKGSILIARLINQPKNTANLIISTIQEVAADLVDPSPPKYFRVKKNIIYSINLHDDDEEESYDYELDLVTSLNTTYIEYYTKQVRHNATRDFPGSIKVSKSVVPINFVSNEDVIIKLFVKMNIMKSKYNLTQDDFTPFNLSNKKITEETFNISLIDFTRVTSSFHFVANTGFITSIKYVYFNTTDLGCPNVLLTNEQKFTQAKYVRIRFPDLEGPIPIVLLEVTFKQTNPSNILSDLDVVDMLENTPNPRINSLGCYTFDTKKNETGQSIIVENSSSNEYLALSYYKSELNKRFSLQNEEFDDDKEKKNNTIIFRPNTFGNLLLFELSSIPYSSVLCYSYVSKSYAENYKSNVQMSYNFSFTKSSDNKAILSISNVQPFAPGKESSVVYYYSASISFYRNLTYIPFSELFDNENYQIIKKSKDLEMQLEVNTDFDYDITVYAFDEYSKIAFSYNTYLAGLNSNNSPFKPQSHSLLILLIILAVVVLILVLAFIAGLAKERFLKKRKNSEFSDDKSDIGIRLA